MPIHSLNQQVTGSVALTEAVSISGSFNVSAVGPETGATGSLAPISGALAGFVDPNGNLMPSRVSDLGHQIVTGSVGLSGPVAVSNFPAVQVVSGSNWIPTITGSVRVENFPVAPAVQDVTGSNWTPTITGSVVVSNTVNVAGTVAVSNFPAVQAVTGSVGITDPVAVLQGTSPWIVSGSNWIPTVTGSVRVENRVDVRVLAMSATLVATPATASANVTIIGANPARSGLTVYNSTGKILYVKLGVSASLTDYTTQMANDDFLEVPFGYTGRVDAFAAGGANGAIRVTEII